MPTFAAAVIEAPGPERRGGARAHRAWWHHGPGLPADDAAQLFARWWRFSLWVARNYTFSDPEHAEEIAAEAWTAICGRSSTPDGSWEKKTVIREVRAAAQKARIAKLPCESLDALLLREYAG